MELPVYEAVYYCRPTVYIAACLYIASKPRRAHPYASAYLACRQNTARRNTAIKATVFIISSVIYYLPVLSFYCSRCSRHQPSNLHIRHLHPILTTWPDAITIPRPTTPNNIPRFSQLPQLSPTTQLQLPSTTSAARDKQRGHFDTTQLSFVEFDIMAAVIQGIFGGSKDEPKVVADNGMCSQSIYPLPYLPHLNLTPPTPSFSHNITNTPKISPTLPQLLSPHPPPSPTLPAPLPLPQHPQPPCPTRSGTTSTSATPSPSSAPRATFSSSSSPSQQSTSSARAQTAAGPPRGRRRTRPCCTTSSL